MSSEKCNQILGRYPSSAASSTSRLSPPSTTTTATHQTWWHDNNSPHHTENRSIRPRLSTSSDNSNIHHNRTSFYSYPYSSYLSNSTSSLAAYNTTDPLPPGSGSNSTSGRRTPTALTSTTTPIAIPIPPIIASFIGSQRKKLGLTMISSSFASSSISTSSASSTTRQHVQGQKRQERQQQQQKSEKLKKKEKGIEREKEKEKEKKAVVPFLNSYSPHPRYRRDSMDLRGWCSNSYDDYNTHYRDLVTPSDGAAVLSTSAASSNYSTSASSSNSGSGSGFPIQQQQQRGQQQQQQQKSLPPLPPSYSSSYSSSSSPPSRRPQPIEHSSEKEVVVSGVNSSTSTSSTSSFLLTSSETTRTSTSTKSTSTTKSPPPHHHHHQKTPSEKNNNNTPYDITATPYNYKKTYEIRAGEKNPSATSKQNSNQQQQHPPGTFTPGPNGGAGLEIHQNGRAIWWVRFQTSFWGAPGIFIEGLPVVSTRMGMSGGKGGGGGGKGKLGAMGEEGGKRRVLAVSFDFLFFPSFLFFVLSICFPFLSLFSFFFFSSHPSFLLHHLIPKTKQNYLYSLSPLYPPITNIFTLPLPHAKTGHKIQIRPFRFLHPPRRPLRTQHSRRTLASSHLQQLERKRIFFRISRSKIRLEEVQSINPPPPISSSLLKPPTNPLSSPSPVTSLLSYLKDTGDYHLLDVDNPGHLLAAYLKDRDWFAFKPIAKMEFYVKLEQGLELMALAAVMGVEERRRRKNAAAGIGGVV